MSTVFQFGNEPSKTRRNYKSKSKSTKYKKVLIKTPEIKKAKKVSVIFNFNVEGIKQIFLNYQEKMTNVYELFNHLNYQLSESDKSNYNKANTSILTKLKEFSSSENIFKVHSILKNGLIEIEVDDSFNQLLIDLKQFYQLVHHSNTILRYLIDNNSLIDKNSKKQSDKMFDTSKLKIPSYNNLLTNTATYNNDGKETKYMLAFASGFAYGQIDHLIKESNMNQINKQEITPHRLKVDYIGTPNSTPTNTNII
jgi:hypothetical protein